MTNPYPIRIRADDGVIEVVGKVTFTDPGNQPGGASAAQIVNVSLTSAQILALDSNPAVLVAAPGSGNLVLPLAVSSVYTFVTTDYTLGGALAINYAGQISGVTGSGWVNISSAGASNAGYAVAEIGDQAVAPPSAIVNTAVVLNCSGGGDPTLGDGTMTVQLVYAVVPVT